MQVAPRLEAILRASDTGRPPRHRCGGPADRTVARLGGDEFAVLLEGLDTWTRRRSWPSGCATVFRRRSSSAGTRCSPRREHRHRDQRAGHAGAGGHGARRGHGDAPGEGVRQGPLRAVRRVDAEAVVERLQLQNDMRRAPGRRRVPPALPADRHRRRRAGRGLRGAAALAAPRAACSRRRLHPGRRGNGADRPHRARGCSGEACRQFAPVARRATRRRRPHHRRERRGQAARCRPTSPRDGSRSLAGAASTPHSLELEITEISADDRSRRGASRCCGAAARLASHLSLDDFGTGYSSLNYVHRFPVDRLKDRSWILDKEAGDLDATARPSCNWPSASSSRLLRKASKRASSWTGSGRCGAGSARGSTSRGRRVCPRPTCSCRTWRWGRSARSGERGRDR